LNADGEKQVKEQLGEKAGLGAQQGFHGQSRWMGCKGNPGVKPIDCDLRSNDPQIRSAKRLDHDNSFGSPK
jgi:hypothetical protein